MKFYIMIFGLAIGTSLVPMRAFAQNFEQGNSGSDGTFTAPFGSGSSGGDSPSLNANPFMGAAGASRFYQDNSLTGSSPLNNAGTPGNNDSSSGPTGGALGGDDNSAGDWATTP